MVAAGVTVGIMGLLWAQEGMREVGAYYVTVRLRREEGRRVRMAAQEEMQGLKEGDAPRLPPLAVMGGSSVTVVGRREEEEREVLV
jgi:hypothetical protein